MTDPDDLLDEARLTASLTDVAELIRTQRAVGFREAIEYLKKLAGEPPGPLWALYLPAANVLEHFEKNRTGDQNV